MAEQNDLEFLELARGRAAGDEPGVDVSERQLRRYLRAPACGAWPCRQNGG